MAGLSTLLKMAMKAAPKAAPKAMSRTVQQARPTEIIEDTSETIIDKGLSSISPKLVKQEYSGQGTTRSQHPALFTDKNFDISPNTTNIDIGGGKFDKGTSYLKKNKKVENLVYDKYNRSAAHNKDILDKINEKPADSATVANVLNVIKEPGVRREVIENSKNLTKKDGKAYFSVFEGDKTGLGQITKYDSVTGKPRDWQNNKRLEEYIPEIEEVFGKGRVEKKGKIIIASKELTPPLKNPKGSVVRRGSNKYPVGKVIGGQVYFHKNYISKMPKEVIDIYKKTINKLPKDHSFNTLMYTPASKGKPASLRFDEAPDFDIAREPIPGRVITITEKGSISPPKDVNQIWHHKWAWVDDDYKGFDVKENYDWSREWFTNKGVKASGSPVKWQEALKEVQLKKRGGMVARNPYPEARGIY